jgi:hypothetical protein
MPAKKKQPHRSKSVRKERPEKPEYLRVLDEACAAIAADNAKAIAQASARARRRGLH